MSPARAPYMDMNGRSKGDYLSTFFVMFNLALPIIGNPKIRDDEEKYAQYTNSFHRVGK